MCGNKIKLINHIIYADDFCIISSSLTVMQTLLNTCDFYAKCLNLSFNPSKTLIQMFTPKYMNSFNETLSITFKDTILRHCDTVKYLGYAISTKKKNRAIVFNEDPETKTRARELYARANMIRCYFAKCSSDVKSLLFRTYFSSIYCSSLWEVDIKKHDQLMVAYNDTLRIVFGLYKFCSASTAFVNARINNLTAVRRHAVFSLLSRIKISKNVILVALYNLTVKDCQSSNLSKIWNHLLKPSTLG